MKKRYLLCLITALTLLTGLMSFRNPIVPEDYRLEYIIRQFNRYIQEYHQNKVYIQTDKNMYKSGETIYLKGYILDDSRKEPENLVKNLYVEIIAPNKQVYMTRLLKIENGIAVGDFPVIDTLKTGIYSMRAYTQNMKNSGNSYLFTKEISIFHPEKLFYSTIFHKKAKKIAKEQKQVDLQFFPESGELVDNIKTFIAFKAIDQTGNSTAVSGKIFSGKNNFICDFKSEHLGMGKIELTPVYHQKYYAIINDEKGKKIKINLPEVMQNGYVLNINDKGNSFEVIIKTNKERSADPVANTVYLIIQSGGKIYSSAVHAFESKSITANIDKKILPQGVTHFTLFDGYGKPWCERIAFVNHNQDLKISYNLEKKQFNKRDKIEFDIQTLNSTGTPCEANVAISVREKHDLGKDNPDIKSYLLLLADLQGKVENPGYYFSSEISAGKNLDLLMLTQGWRKFLWKDILRDSIPKTEFPIETDLRITGKITKYFLGIPVKHANIKLTLLNKFNDVFKTTSAKKGYYEFLGLNYSDTLDVLIEVRTQFNRKNVLILVDESRILENTFFPYKGFYLDSLKIKHREEYKQPVEVIDTTKPQEFKIYSQADQVIKFDDKVTNSGQNIMDILRSRVPGLNVGQNGSGLRGGSIINNQPLYLLDGMQINYFDVQSISVYDVDHVDILKGASAAIYGINGGNGVIAIYTKKGFYMKRGEIRFKMLGYHTSKVFYSPKYTSKENDNEIIDDRTTIFWSPTLKTDTNGIAHVEFYHSDIPGEYEIVIEGMDKSGIVGSFIDSYSVN
jgi:TonB-dependent SusC/RagA subfamily outer membrane receptor